jgi:murein DD-endopeptidase MepM/ murein hydrolase activator NlpD
MIDENKNLNSGKEPTPQPQNDAGNPEYFEGGVDPEPTMGPEQPSPPGGPAVRPQSAQAKPTNALKSVAEKGAKQVIKRGLDVATEGIAELPVVRNIVNWASDKLAKEAIKKWAYGLAAGVWGTIGPYATVIIIVIILLFVIAGPAFARIGKARRGADGNETPTPISIIDPEDRAILVELSKLTGSGSAVDATAIKVLIDRIETRIASGNSHFSDNTQAVTLIQEIGTLCDQIIGGDTSQKTKQSLVDAIQKLIDLYLGDNPPPLSGDFFPPTGTQKPSHFNGTLHTRSTMRPEAGSGHNVFKGYGSPGTGDAVDIGTGSSGSPVYAMFDGKVSHATNAGEKAATQCLVLTANSGTDIEAWYCHVKGDSKESVNAGDKIGETAFTNGGHLHLEVWIGGKSVHTTQADLASKKYEQKGKYLWDHLLVIFNNFTKTP